MQFSSNCYTGDQIGLEGGPAIPNGLAITNPPFMIDTDNIASFSRYTTLLPGEEARSVKDDRKIQVCFV